MFFQGRVFVRECDEDGIAIGVNSARETSLYHRSIGPVGHDLRNGIGGAAMSGKRNLRISAERWNQRSALPGAGSADGWLAMAHEATVAVKSWSETAERFS